MSESKAQSAASATATNIHSIRAFARCADDDRPTIKSPRKPNHIVPQPIRRATEVDGIREQLLALTPLESTFAASLVALDEDRVPRWWSVRELIAAFLHLRDSAVLRRSEYRLEKVTARRVIWWPA
jgi:DNA gyrase/topoisomerase IV subunit A